MVLGTALPLHLFVVLRRSRRRSNGCTTSACSRCDSRRDSSQARN